MKGRRGLASAGAIFVVGLVAVVVGLDQYDEAYTWVAHTSDVRLVIGRALGDSRTPACGELRTDATELARLTQDNPQQQARLPALGHDIEEACAGRGTVGLVDELAALDATERALMTERRARLARIRRWSLLAFALSTLGAAAALIVAARVQGGALRALRENEERFRFLASSSSDLVRIHDPRGRPTYVSPSVRHLLGYTEEELLGEVPLSLGHPDDLERMREALANVQAPGSTASTLVYRLRTKAGAYRWFETHTNPIHDDRGALLHFYTTARDITDRVALEKQLELAAVTDELTTLLNRRGFLLIAGQELRVAARLQHGVAVIFADLDGLKAINDGRGHEHGDLAIRQCAEILRTTFRDSDVVARLGGDEFAVLAYNVDQAKVDTVLARVESKLRQAAAAGPYPLSVSFGVALADAASAPRSLEDLLAEADQHMYERKRERSARREPSA